MIPPSTTDAFRRALARFDQELRASPDWADWETNRNHKFAVRDGGRLYPVKQLISMASGAPVSSFNGGEPSNRYVRDLGFEVIELAHEGGVAESGSIQSSLVEVLEGYAGARLQPFAGAHPVVQALQRAARLIKAAGGVQSRSHIGVVASAGRGNWARVPWISLLDDRETDTTQRGVYVVLLFREDLNGVYVTLNQGVTEPQKRLGRAAGLEEIRRKAQQLRTTCADLGARGFLLDGQIDLAVEGGLGADYEASTIAYKFYPKGSVPADVEIIEDIDVLLGAYDRYLSEPSDAVDSSVGAWIFQSSPETWDLRSALKSLKRLRWLVAQHRDKIKPGALVYLWQSGPEAGVLAVAKVVAAPAELPDLDDAAPYRVDKERFEGTALRAELEVQHVLPSPLLRSELSTHPVLSRLSILAQPIGTNFPVTQEQAKALKAMVDNQVEPVERLTFLHAATKILREKGSPMRVSDLWAEMDSRRLVASKGKSPGSTLYSLMLRSSKGEVVSGSLPLKFFYKAGPSLFGLLEWLSEAQLKELEEAEKVAVAGDSEIAAEPFERKPALQALVTAVEKMGYVFEPWHIAAYVTALRTKPFVILAGVSGTGKSKLPGLVADLTGAAHELIPVRPDWTDSSDVLGYVDLQGEFRPGALLGVVRAASRKQDKHHVCIVDEMNLARVEQYFAEVLSRLEDRTVIDGETSTRPLLVQRLSVDDEWGELGLPGNCAIVGTVNMDESTHGFSRKVLDRAFTIELSDVDLERWEGAEGSDAVAASWPVSAWRPRAVRLAEVKPTPEERELIGRSIAALTELNGMLVQAQLQVGYRVRDEVALFVLNAQEVMDVFVTRGGRQVDPLDLAIQMKILPRIAGGSSSVRSLVAHMLGWAKTGKPDRAEEEVAGIAEAWRAAGRPASIADAKYPMTAARLALMWDRLLVEGFTSYWL